MKKYFLYPVLFLTLVIIDKIIKVEILSNGWVLVNHGMAFGIYIPEWIILISSFVLLMFIIFLYIRFSGFRLALIILLAGAFGNLSDRMIWGGVVDYIKVLTFPVFNLSDLMIIVSGLFLVISKIVYGKTRIKGNNRG